MASRGPSRRPHLNDRGLTSLWVEGYKSLHDLQRIDIRPLTILAGVNSAGKSSILQPLLLMKQTLDAPYDPGPLQLDGPNVSVTAIEQVLSRQTKSKQIKQFSVGFTLGRGRELEVTFGRSSTSELELVQQVGVYTRQKGKLTIRPGMSERDVLALIPEDTQEAYSKLRVSTRYAWQVYRERCFLNVGFIPTGGVATGRSGALAFLDTDDAEQEIASIIHLPGLRGNPSRTYRTTAVGLTFPGTFETYTAAVIRSWQRSKNVTKLNLLRSDLEALALTWKVEVRPIDDTQVELLVGRLPHARQGGAQDLVNIADVGFGVSQTLPVLVALLVARPGQMVYLEQPEIHLHPRAQLHFAAILARAASSGVRIVVETHSSLLIRGIQTLVAKDEIRQDLIRLHWFQRSPVTGFSNIVSGELDADGAFGDWPEDFDEVLLEAERTYLDAAELKVHE